MRKLRFPSMHTSGRADVAALVLQEVRRLLTKFDFGSKCFDLVQYIKKPIITRVSRIFHVTTAKHTIAIAFPVTGRVEVWRKNHVPLSSLSELELRSTFYVLPGKQIPSTLFLFLGIPVMEDGRRTCYTLETRASVYGDLGEFGAGHVRTHVGSYRGHVPVVVCDNTPTCECLSRRSCSGGHT